MRRIVRLRTTRLPAALALGLAIAAWAWAAQADPLLHSKKAHDPEALEAVRRAQQEVDRAWDVFHRAALGGTLASPVVQANAEQALHESRGLLVKAREAADRGDRTALRPLLNRIHELTARAITESQEQKR